jgi:hypothetical protein
VADVLAFNYLSILGAEVPCVPVSAPLHSLGDVSVGFLATGDFDDLVDLLDLMIKVVSYLTNLSVSINVDSLHDSDENVEQVSSGFHVGPGKMDKIFEDIFSIVVVLASVADVLALLGLTIDGTDVQLVGVSSPFDGLDGVLLFPRFNNDFLFYLLDHMSDRLSIMMN